MGFTPSARTLRRAKERTSECCDEAPGIPIAVPVATSNNARFSTGFETVAGDAPTQHGCRSRACAGERYRRAHYARLLGCGVRFNRASEAFADDNRTNSSESRGPYGHPV
jgi:hypothetical protein